MQENKRDFSIFKERILEYLEKKDISKYECYKNTGMSRSVLSQPSGMTEDNLLRFLAYYTDINPTWLITGEGNMLKEEKKESSQSEKLKKASEAMTKYEDKKKNDIITIPIVEIYAAAGHGYMNTDSLIPTGEINLPKAMFRSGGLRYCIRVKGFSMAPTLQDSDFLIIRHLEPVEWQSMSDEHVYLVVDKDGMAYVKRVKNRLDRGFIVLTSDSIEKSSYPNFNLQADEIANIFYAEWHFSAKMQNINETYYDRLKSLEDRFDNFENMMKISEKE